MDYLCRTFAGKAWGRDKDKEYLIRNKEFIEDIKKDRRRTTGISLGKLKRLVQEVGSGQNTI